MNAASQECPKPPLGMRRAPVTPYDCAPALRPDRLIYGTNKQICFWRTAPARADRPSDSERFRRIKDCPKDSGDSSALSIGGLGWKSRVRGARQYRKRTFGPQ